MTFVQSLLGGIIKRWPKLWIVRFSVRILSNVTIQGNWPGVIQFRYSNAVNKHGERQPCVKYNNIGDKLEFSYHLGTQRYARQISISKDLKYDIEMKMVLDSDTYYFQVYLDGQKVFNVGMWNPDEFENMEYYYGAINSNDPQNANNAISMVSSSFYGVLVSVVIVLLCVLWYVVKPLPPEA